MGTSRNAGLVELQVQGTDSTSTVGFTKIADVMDINGPGFKRETAEVTDRDSDQWKEFISTLKEIGEVTFDLNLDLEEATHGNIATAGGVGVFSHDGLYKMLDDGNSHVFKLDFPGASDIQFSALVIGYAISAPYQSSLASSITLKGTGAPTVT